MSSQLVNESKRSKYRILGLVGQGQFGRVYCAVHRQTGRLVALKNLEHQRFPTHKFLRELRFLLSLQHPNIVTCQALEHTQNGRYLVMDYCEGGTLRSIMEGDYGLSLPLCLRLVIGILEGLGHAHSRGIVHCDIKPENILLSVQPTGWVARISDFGIAKLSQEITGEESSNTGSPAYMAPERFYGQYSISSDLYSVGIILFELIAGYRPFSGTPVELMSAHLNVPLKLPDIIPAGLRPILSTALQKLPGRRFRSANDMLVALRTAASSLFDEASHDPLIICPPVDTACQLDEATPKQVLSHAYEHLLVATPAASFAYKRNPTRLAIYGAGGESLTMQTLDISKFSEQGEVLWDTAQLLPLGSPIGALLPHGHRCCVAAGRSLYEVDPHPSEADRQKSLIVTGLPDRYLTAIDPDGRWLAIATPTTEETQFSFYPLRSSRGAVWVPADPLRLSSRAQMGLMSVLSLESKHLVLLSYLYRKESKLDAHRDLSFADSIGTLLEVYTRRGERLATLTLPLRLKTVIRTATPYRLLATDDSAPNSVLQIDLKPYRVSRLGVSIVPEFLVATSWGAVLANTAGQIILMDEYGHQAGLIEGPANITAIASFAHHGLLIATWDQSVGHLYTVNLKTLDVELMF
ncbi:MAG TPA: serine/threonine-protein kinase [Chroococcidiopsis sp.]